MKFDRQFYTPRNSRRVRVKDLPAVELRAYEVDGRNGRLFYALGWHSPKATKPAFHYSFRSEAARERYVGQWLEGQRRAVAYKAEREARRKAEAAKGHGLEVGTVLVSSWGYEQTNVDFYRVEALVGKTMVELVKLAAATCNSDGSTCGAMSEYVTATDEPCGERFRRRGLPGGRVRIHSSATASVWDGKRRYCSWYA